MGIKKGGGFGESITSKRRLDAVEKKRQALMLRTSGATYEAIAEKLGYKTPAGAYKAVTTALRDTLKEPAEELRTMELRRLDQAQLAIATLVRQGDLKAIDRWLRISAQRCQLLGLNAPVGIQIQQQIENRLTHEINLLFEIIASDPSIPDVAKQRVFEAAAQLQQRAELAAMS